MENKWNRKNALWMLLHVVLYAAGTAIVCFLGAIHPILFVCYQITGSLVAAVEEMPAGYADQMISVIGNIPVLILMLVLVIPSAILGMCAVEKILKEHAALLR